MRMIEFRRIFYFDEVSKTFEKEWYFEPNGFSSNFRSFFEAAIVSLFAQNCANREKSGEILNAVSPTMSNFRN